MKANVLFTSLVFCGFLLVSTAAVADEASPVSPVSMNKQTASESVAKKIEKTGLGRNVAAMVSKPLPTVIPTPEYRKLPAYDFVPKSKREVLV